MTNNSFARYGIEHLSPSACNQFIGSPGMFILERLMKNRFSVGPAAHRGTAVETGIVHGLMTGASNKECCELALAEFSKLTALSGDPRIEKERGNIDGMVVNGLAELRSYGKPTSTQGKIEWHVDGLAVPFIGFYDIEWADHGILVDIKTTSALPSKISTNHARQVALYRAARDNIDTRVTYVTSKKVATYALENPREHLDALARVGKTIQNFLAISDDPRELAKLVAPDVDSFYFSDPLARKMAFDVWGL